MTFEWLKHVDGINIFPTLPVYLRTHYAAHEKCLRVDNAVRAAATGQQRLRELNTQLSPWPEDSAVTHAAVTAAISAAQTQNASDASHGPSVVGMPVPEGSTLRPGLFSLMQQHLNFPSLPQPLAMPLPPTWMVNNAPHEVGGITIGGQPPVAGALPESQSKKGHGKRGRDTKQRQPPKPCRNCVARGEPLERAAICKGRWPRGTCPLAVILQQE